MFEVSVEQTFAAGHALRNYRGKCENVHGHNYRVQVNLEGEQLDKTGLLVDFTEVKRAMREVIETLDHQFINDIPPFTELNPSSENMALYFYQRLTDGIHAETPVRITAVTVWETDIQSACYRP